MMNIPWDQPATLIDLDGKTPVIGSMLECVMHVSLFKPFAKEQTRTWVLNPDEIEKVVERLNAEREAAR